jgi:hypothetical protein
LWGRASHSLTGPFPKIAGSILPAAALVLLPKCPLCLAAWLTVATGIGFSAAGAEWVRASLVLSLVLFGVAAVAPMFWRKVFGRAPLRNS